MHSTQCFRLVFNACNNRNHFPTHTFKTHSKFNSIVSFRQCIIVHTNWPHLIALCNSVEMIFRMTKSTTTHYIITHNASRYQFIFYQKKITNRLRIRPDLIKYLRATAVKMHSANMRSWMDLPADLSYRSTSLESGSNELNVFTVR